MRLGPLLAAASACLALAGCAPVGDAGPGAAASAPEPREASPTATLAAGALGVLEDKGRVQIGQDADSALALSPAAGKTLAVDTLPSGIPDPPYAAKGWNTPDGAKGFGLILRDGQTVAVVLARDLVAPDAADRLQAAYADAFGAERAEDVVREGFAYQFYDDGENRLMVMRGPETAKGCPIVVALGPASLLNVLRASPGDARADLDRLVASGSAPKTEPSGEPGPSK